MVRFQSHAKLLAIGLAAAVAALAPPAQAAFPGGNGRIAYETASSVHQPRIFSVRPDGSDTRQLTFGELATEDGSPSWSADGRRLVFVRTGVATLKVSEQVTTIDADGGDLTPVILPPVRCCRAEEPSFSPNGRRILYSRGTSIFTVAVGGGKPREVKALDSSVTDPQYSPSGRRIVFVMFGRRGKRSSVWSMRRDGSGLRRLTDPGQISPDHFDRAPDYSPDGRQIAFARGDESGGTAIHVMRADGSDERPVPDTEGALDPAYSPAGDRIAISALAEPSSEFFAGCREIFTISPTGADRQRVTQSCEIESAVFTEALSWQPDPPSTFGFGKAKKNRRRGTAKLPVAVPGPGELDLAKTLKVKGASEHSEAGRTVTLPVKPRAKARKQLRRDGSAKVRADVTYTPDGAGPNTLSKRIGLRRR